MGTTASFWRNRLWTGVRSDRGSQLLEAALVLGILLSLVFGIIFISRAFSASETMTLAAREGARLALAPSCATCGNQRPSASEVQEEVRRFLRAASFDPDEMQNFSVEWDVVLNPGQFPTERGVILSFQYPYDLWIPFTPVNVTSLALRAEARMRQE
jgi:hypothetical protein